MNAKQLARFASMTLAIAVVIWLRYTAQLSITQTVVVWLAFCAVYALSAIENR